MLNSLRIQNIAIVESLEIDLKPGLNILTGETGAGKSIILKSIELICGKRASASYIRAGSDKAVVEALFILDSETNTFIFDEYPELDDVLDRSDPELIIKRVIDISGRSKFYINGSIFNQNTVSRVMSHLVEITGQNDQSNLRESNYHRQILDSYGTEKRFIDEVKTAFENYKVKKNFIEKLKNSKEELIFRLDRLTSIRDELKKLSLKPGEKDELVIESERVKHLDKMRSGTDEIVSILDGVSLGKTSNYADSDSSSGNISPYDAISKAYKILESFISYDKSIANVLQTAQQALTCISELNSQVQDIGYNLNFDPEKFELIQSRLGQINIAERKYNKNSEELIEYLKEVEDELAQYEGSLFDEKKLDVELTDLKNILTEKEGLLTASRLKVAKKLSKDVSSNLNDLSMPKARFEVLVQTKESSSNGADEIIFKFSANPGEPLQPLEKVASGGELSRLQLILKSISQTSKIKSLNIFDEIDTGVSGATSQVVGEKLLSLSKKSQIIVITHSAQIAALADNHIFVEKEVKNDRTFSKVSYLNEKERVNVIAGMLAGKNVSQEFLNSANSLLEGRKAKR